MDEFDLPEMVDISPEAIAAADSILDPTLTPPDDARKDVDRKSKDVYYRWSENLVIEEASRRVTPKKLTEYKIVAKIRPGARDKNKNVGKNVYSRYRINFKVLSGQEENSGHTWMNKLSLAALVSLLRSVGFMPAEGTGISVALLKQLFPDETEKVTSPLLGKTAIGSLVDRPNKGEQAKYDRQTEVETWFPEQ